MNSKKLFVIWLGAVSGIVLLGSPRASALGMQHRWGEMSAFELKPGQVVCAGRIVGHRPLPVSPGWRSDYSWIPVAKPQEIDFLVDNVISGPRDGEGGTIQVRCAVVGDGLAKFDLTKTVAGRRCVLYLVLQGDSGGAYELVDGKEFLLLGPRPQGADADLEKLTPSERLGLELANAILCDDPAVAAAAIRSAAPGRMDTAARARVVPALTARKSAPDRDLAIEAVAALLRLGDDQTLLELKALLDQWSKSDNFGAAAKTVREGLASTKDPASVPLLVELSTHRSEEIRAGALRSLRYIRSRDAVAALARSLDEPNLDLRYNAIMGLAYQTGRLDPQWATSSGLFMKAPDALTAKWKGWWEETDKTQYPSIEDVISKAEEKRKALEN